MDVTWFKQKQREQKVTSHDLGAALNRDRTIVSRILNGRQKMTLAQAEVFARHLRVDVETILAKAGIGEQAKSDWAPKGFAEAEAAHWQPKEEGKYDALLRCLGVDPSAVEIWRLKTDLLDADGFRNGDFLAVDHNGHEEAKGGDIVVAQIYDNALGTAETVVRRYAPPALVTSHASPQGREIAIVDRRNTVIRGRVVASWRTSDPTTQ